MPDISRLTEKAALFESGFLVFIWKF